jgi:cytochrome c oxidase subunit IV
MSDNHSGHFIIPLKYYVGTLIGLLILTVVTVAVAQIDLGGLNIVVAMGVAMLKASLVIMFFMGVKWDEGFNKVVLFGSLVFIFLFMGIVLLDVFTRGDVYSNEAEVHDIKSPVHVVPGYSSHH